jgi:hypothetical protein
MVADGAGIMDAIEEGAKDLEALAEEVVEEIEGDDDAENKQKKEIRISDIDVDVNTGAKKHDGER